MGFTDELCQRRLKVTVSVRESVRRLLGDRSSSGTSDALALFRGLELYVPTEMLRWSVSCAPNALNLKPSTIETLQNCHTASSSMNLGFSPICVVGVIPLSMPAQEVRKTALQDALCWSAERVTKGERATGEMTVAQDLCADYLKRLWLLAQLSPWVCAVTMGIDVALAKTLRKPEFDRLTQELFLQHFSLKLRFRGSCEAVGDAGSIQIQERFCDYLSAKNGGRKNCKLRLLWGMFGYRPEVERTLLSLSAGNVIAVVGRLSEMFVELRLTEKTMSRLLNLVLADEVTAGKLARSLRWQICSMEAEKVKHAPTPHGEVKDVLLQMVRSMIVDALGGTYTAEDVVEVFVVVCRLCLRTLSIDLVPRREGFWIPWFEQQLYPFLENLTKASLNREELCGESEELSAKSNLKGEV